MLFKIPIILCKQLKHVTKQRQHDLDENERQNYR